jgi:hypothetical protein
MLTTDQGQELTILSSNPKHRYRSTANASISDGRRQCTALSHPKGISPSRLWLDFGGGFNAYLTRKRLKKVSRLGSTNRVFTKPRWPRIFERTRGSLGRTCPSRQTDMTSSLPRK